MISIINSPKWQKEKWTGTEHPTKMAHTEEWRVFWPKQTTVTPRTVTGTGDVGTNEIDKPPHSWGSCSNWREIFLIQSLSVLTELIYVPDHSLLWGLLYAL